MKELQRNLSPRYTNLLESQTHLLCTKTWRASKFSHLFNPPCNSQGACFAPSIKYLYPSFMVRFYFTTCSSYQSVSKPTNCQNNIHLQVIFCKKSWLNVFIGGFFCTNTSLYRKLFFCNRDNFSSAQDFKWKREVNSFKQEQ